LKANVFRVQKNLHSLFGSWSNIHNGGLDILTMLIFLKGIMTCDPSFCPKYNTD